VIPWGRCAALGCRELVHTDGGHVNSRRTRLLLGTAIGLVLSACGAEDTEASPAAPTVTVTATPSTEAPTSTSRSPDNSPTPDNAPSSSAGSVPTDRVGQPLSLSDAQSFYPEWEEGLYEVADRSDVRAMGVSVTGCGLADYSPHVEFRLANRFNSLSMNVAQANSSESSDQTLVVVVEGNDEQIDIRQVPFNEVVSISGLDISGVNALRVRMYLDDEDEDCGSGGGTTAVIEQLVVT
jgi:hypothetical protein